jgi:hypothetical protein
MNYFSHLRAVPTNPYSHRPHAQCPYQSRWASFMTSSFPSLGHLPPSRETRSKQSVGLPPGPPPVVTPEALPWLAAPPPGSASGDGLSITAAQPPALPVVRRLAADPLRDPLSHTHTSPSSPTFVSSPSRHRRH